VSEEDVDLVAIVEAPAPVKQASKAKAAVPKKEAASKAVEAPVFPNKAECNDAEAKFQAELSKVFGNVRVLLFIT